MQPQIELAYLGIEVPDPAALDPFFGDLIGLQPGEPDGEARTWRNDDRARRIIVRPGPVGDAVFVGFEAVDADAFDATTASLSAAGCEVTDGGVADCRQRRVERLARTTAPWGIDVEVVERLATAPTAFASPLMPGGFLTEGVGFGHVVFATTAFDESCRFLTAGLGLVRSDWLQMELVEGIELVVQFFHCNERHHTVALAKAPFDDIEIVGSSVDWEVELVAVIGRRADRVAEADGWAHVAGLTVGQDISDRHLQFAAGAQFSLGKSRRGYGPMGPWLVTPDELADRDDLALGCAVDGETVQDARTGDLIFGVPRLVAELSAVLPLLPGDVIFTGTPAGVGATRQPPRFLQPGEVLETWIEGIGTIRNRCV